jgi:hypothetical protein
MGQHAIPPSHLLVLTFSSWWLQIVTIPGEDKYVHVSAGSLQP